MDQTRVRVIRACDRCRRKKAKCNGKRGCDRCDVDSAMCTYDSDGVRETKKNAVRLLETQNRQLSGAVQRLYAYALSGQRLPALSVRVAENGQPYVHDIVAYINTLPTEPVGANDGTPGKSVARAVFSNNAEAESSFDLSPVSSLGRTESQLSYPKFFPESPRYENLEDVDLQCLWSLIDVDAPEAASLCNWLDAHNM